MKVLITFAVSASIAAACLAASSTAKARTQRHHQFTKYGPYIVQPGYRSDPFHSYRRAYAYRPAYPRVPVYNRDDATKLNRQMMGLGD